MNTISMMAIVDRLWPRGLSTKTAYIDEWDKKLSPSSSLRKWFDHDLQKWDDFQQKYPQELKENPLAKHFLVRHADQDIIILLYAARDQQYNHAIVLKSFLNNI